MNFVISSWPGAGATTLTLLLAKMLNKKLLQGTYTFRHIQANINIEDKIQKDDYVQTHWGPVYEKYIMHKIKTEDGLIIDSDITGFFVQADNLISVFLYADEISRSKRLFTDKRNEDLSFLKSRDEYLKNKYKELFDVDFFDLEKIKKIYKVPIDNSTASINDELRIVFTYLNNNHLISQEEKNILDREVDTEVQNYIKAGKEYYLKYLKDSGNLKNGEEVLKEVASLLKNDIEKLPEDIKRVILG